MPLPLEPDFLSLRCYFNSYGDDTPDSNSRWSCSKGVRNSGSYVLTEKLKAIEVKLKDWNREVFGRVDVGKNSALKKVVYWDAVEAQKPLFLNESEEKVATLESFKSWSSLEETF